MFTAKQEAMIMERFGALLKADAIRRCPVDNGELRRHIDFIVNGDTLTFYCDSPYAAYIEYGTGKYHLDDKGNPQPRKGWDIVPKHAKALKFEIDGRTVFAKKVHIEGMQAQPFMRPALHQTLPKMKGVIRAVMAT